MLTPLSQHAYAMVAPLLTGFDQRLSVRAVLAGAIPGAVFVDDPVQPSAVFVHSAEGNFVGGDPRKTRFVTDLRAHLAATFVPERDGDLVLFFDHDGWPPVAQAIAPDLVMSGGPGGTTCTAASSLGRSRTRRPATGLRRSTPHCCSISAPLPSTAAAAWPPRSPRPPSRSRLTAG